MYIYIDIFICLFINLLLFVYLFIYKLKTEQKERIFIGSETTFIFP